MVIDNVDPRPYTFDRVVRILFTVAVVCAGVWLIKRLSSVLLPFVVAWLISYVLEPFVIRNKRLLRSKGRLFPVMLTLLEALLLTILFCVLFMPSIFEEIHQVAELVRQYASTDTYIAFIPQEVHDYLRDNIDFYKISQEMSSQDIQSLIGTLASFISGGVSIIMGFFNWILVVLYVIFIMLDYDKLSKGFKRMVPHKYRRTAFSVGNDVKDSMNHYFRGQALVALCVGVLFSIGFLILGMPLAVVLGLFIGLLNMVPYLQLVSIPITTVLCLVYSVEDNINFWTIWWSCMAVYIIVQCIQDLILTPKIMGKAMGLNPAIILLALSVWGSLLGFIGLVIALPLTTLIISYYSRYVINRQEGETPSQRRADVKAVKEMVEEPVGTDD